LGFPTVLFRTFVLAAPLPGGCRRKKLASSISGPGLIVTAALLLAAVFSEQKAAGFQIARQNAPY
jgi:hypothetical protein